MVRAEPFRMAEVDGERGSYCCDSFFYNLNVFPFIPLNLGARDLEVVVFSALSGVQSNEPLSW